MREWTRDEIRRIGYLVVDLIAEHLSTLPDEPVFRPVPASSPERFLSTPAPTMRRRPRSILREFRDTIEPYPFGNGHPRFWGWVNSPPAVMGIFADALAAAMNPSCAGGNHAAIYVERQVIEWFRDLLGFPAESMGLLVSGGSMATMTGLAVARHVKSGVDVRAAGLRDAPRPFAFYMSPEGARLRAEGDRVARIRQFGDPDDADRRRLPDERRRARAGDRRRPRARHTADRGRSPAPARPTPARSTNRPRLRTSARGMASGCTSTQRTAARRSSRPPTQRGWRRSRAPTASRSTRTSGCSSRSKPDS